MSQEEFHKLVERLEREEFPEIGKEPRPVYLAKGAFRETDGGYQVFTPSYNIKSGLLTERGIEEIASQEKALLSVGCGPAYLERLLVRRFGIKPSQITLGDVSSEDVPEGFEFHEFDMYGAWPAFEQPFDLMIFPMALSSLFYAPIDQWGEKVGRVFLNALRNLRASGEARLNGMDPSVECHREIIDGAYDSVRGSYPTANLDFEAQTIVLRL
jgi:hypothetical protein